MLATARNGTLELRGSVLIWTGRVEVEPVSIPIADITRLHEKRRTATQWGQVTISTEVNSVAMEYLEQEELSFQSIIAAILSEKPSLKVEGERRSFFRNLLSR